MDKFKSRINALDHVLGARIKFINGTFYEYFFVSIAFFLLTLALTNFTLLNGHHQLFIEGPGDGTAGFLWFNSVDTDLNPALSHTDMANYPVGETLQNPTQVTYTAVLFPLWAMSRLFGPIMGLNIITFFGLWSCALATYWLVKRLAGDSFASFFAAYAAAYIPYHLIKSSSHLTYIFSVVFVLMLAAFIAYWKRPTVHRAMLFAASLALAFYTDGYFLLIGSIFAVSLLLGGILYDIYNKQLKVRILLHLKHAVVAIATVAILLVPIGITQLTQASKVDSFLSSARGSIAFDIEYYSTHLTDFLIPSPLNPFLKDNQDFQEIVAYQNRRSNGSENLMYIGWIVTILIIIGAVLLFTHALTGKKSHLGDYRFIENYKLVFAVTLAAAPVLVLCMLSPSFTLKGLPIVTLGDILLHYDISLWRVMARFYLPLHIVLVIAAAMSLAAFVSPYKPKNLKHSLTSRKGYLYIAVIATATLLTAAEYASVNSRPSYDFNNIPKAYSWIKEQDNIKVIAEMPLVDRPLAVNYDFATAQVVHGKKTVNTPLTTNVPGGRTALGNIDSVEAINYSIARGADTIITHNQPCRDRDWGRVVYVDSNKPQTRESVYYGSPICVYAVNKSYKTDPLFVRLQFGTFSDAPYTDKSNGTHYQMIYKADGWIDIVDVLGNSVRGGVDLSARIQSTPDAISFKGTWSVYQAGKVVDAGLIPGDIKVRNLDASLPIRVHVEGHDGSVPEVFQVSLRDVVVSRSTERED